MKKEGRRIRVVQIDLGFMDLFGIRCIYQIMCGRKNEMDKRIGGSALS